MTVPTHELLLALRAPNSGWLAAVVCALDEAMRDPDFGEPQRALLRRLLETDTIPAAVTDAATARLHAFEKAVQSLYDSMLDAIPAVETETIVGRPNLTVCGGSAA
jgi:hypothetical protein